MDDVTGGTVMARPRKARIACWIGAVAIFVLFTVIATGLRGSNTGMGQKQAVFQASDQYAMIGLGVLAALGILMFTRPKVVADRRGIRIRNIVGSYDLPWQVVRAVTFRPGSPWVVLDLQDDDVVAVMAVQATDKEYAVRAARQLRALHAAALGLGSSGGSATQVDPRGAD